MKNGRARIRNFEAIEWILTYPEMDGLRLLSIASENLTAPVLFSPLADVCERRDSARGSDVQ